MPPRSSSAYHLALQVLSDGDWHDYRRVVSEVMRVIEPGVAMRRAEANRIATARETLRSGRIRTNSERLTSRKVQRDAAQLVLFGARSIAQEVLANSKTFETFPRGPNKPDKRIRIRPEVIDARLGGKHPGQQPRQE